MNHRASLAALAAALFLALACGGGSVPDDDPGKDPKKPADNAGECAEWNGASLPRKGGVITSCSSKQVSIDHHEDAKPIRWDYLEMYLGKGWTRGDPLKGNPVANKGGKRLTFKASGNTVTIEGS